MKKKFVMLAFCALMLCGCGEVPKLKNGEESVVSFENEDLSISVDKLYESVKNRYALNTLIEIMDETILSKKYPDATKDKEEYVKVNLESVKSNFKTDEEFIQAINYYYGYTTEEEFTKFLGLNYMRNLAVVDYAKTLITEKEAKNYYEKDIVGDIKCSHILIKVTTTDKMTDEEKAKVKSDALTKANEIVAKLKNAKDLETEFAALAKEYSEDTASKEDGGNVGYFNKGKMDEAFETAAYKLSVGKYTTTPVLSSFGYHIILKTDAKDKKSYDDVKTSIFETLAKEKISANAEIEINALTKLREEYGMDFHDDELAKQYTNYIQNLIKNANSTTKQE